jgi:hypothetical protein
MICIKCAQEECILENRNSAVDNMDAYVHHNGPPWHSPVLLKTNSCFVGKTRTFLRSQWYSRNLFYIHWSSKKRKLPPIRSRARCTKTFTSTRDCKEFYSSCWGMLGFHRILPAFLAVRNCPSAQRERQRSVERSAQNRFAKISPHYGSNGVLRSICVSCRWKLRRRGSRNKHECGTYSKIRHPTSSWEYSVLKLLYVALAYARQQINAALNPLDKYCTKYPKQL